MKKINNEKELKDALLKKGVTVLKVSAEWCGPCKVLSQNIESIEENNPKIAKFVEADVDEADEDFVESLKIKGVPALFFYKNGENVDRVNGLMTEQNLLDKIKEIKG